METKDSSKNASASFSDLTSARTPSRSNSHARPRVLVARSTSMQNVLRRADSGSSNRMGLIRASSTRSLTLRDSNISSFNQSGELTRVKSKELKSVKSSLSSSAGRSLSDANSISARVRRNSEHSNLANSGSSIVRPLSKPFVDSKGSTSKLVTSRRRSSFLNGRRLSFSDYRRRSVSDMVSMSRSSHPLARKNTFNLKTAPKFLRAKLRASGGDDISAWWKLYLLDFPMIVLGGLICHIFVGLHTNEKISYAYIGVTGLFGYSTAVLGYRLHAPDVFLEKLNFWMIALGTILLASSQVALYLLGNYGHLSLPLHCFLVLFFAVVFMIHFMIYPLGILFQQERGPRFTKGCKHFFSWMVAIVSICGLLLNILGYYRVVEANESIAVNFFYSCSIVIFFISLLMAAYVIWRKFKFFEIDMFQTFIAGVFGSATTFVVPIFLSIYEALGTVPMLVFLLLYISIAKAVLQFFVNYGSNVDGFPLLFLPFDYFQEMSTAILFATSNPTLWEFWAVLSIIITLDLLFDTGAAQEWFYDHFDEKDDQLGSRMSFSQCTNINKKAQYMLEEYVHMRFSMYCEVSTSVMVFIFIIAEVLFLRDLGLPLMTSGEDDYGANLILLGEGIVVILEFIISLMTSRWLERRMHRILNQPIPTKQDSKRKLQSTIADEENICSKGIRLAYSLMEAMLFAPSLKAVVIEDEEGKREGKRKVSLYMDEWLSRQLAHRPYIVVSGLYGINLALRWHIHVEDT